MRNETQSSFLTFFCFIPLCFLEGFLLCFFSAFYGCFFFLWMILFFFLGSSFKNFLSFFARVFGNFLSFSLSAFSFFFFAIFLANLLFCFFVSFLFYLVGYGEDDFLFGRYFSFTRMVLGLDLKVQYHNLYELALFCKGNSLRQVTPRGKLILLTYQTVFFSSLSYIS